ncbi:MAG: hypothetical protein HC861_03235 [Rhodospirillaceae bacterium]|nr:hypothetical protein [Rhodospirillaceae bacterium]
MNGQMRSIGRGICLSAALLCWTWFGQAVAADEIQAPWEPLPADAKLVTDPAALTALLADHTVHGVYLQDGSKWREYSAADGRTVWEVDGCLHPGTWRVSGSTVCYVYPSWDDGRPQCFLVYQSARLTHFVWLDPATGDGWLITNAPLDLAAGNPDHLPLDARRPAAIRRCEGVTPMILTSPQSADRIVRNRSTASGAS